MWWCRGGGRAGGMRWCMGKSLAREVVCISVERAGHGVSRGAVIGRVAGDRRWRCGVRSVAGTRISSTRVQEDAEHLMTPPHLTRADYIRTLPTASRRMHRTHFATRTSQFALGRRRTAEAGPFRIQISGTRLEVGNLTSADAADARLRRVDGRRCAAIRDQPRHDRPLARCAGVVCTAAHPGARGHHRRQRLSRSGPPIARSVTPRHAASLRDSPSCPGNARRSALPVETRSSPTARTRKPPQRPSS